MVSESCEVKRMVLYRSTTPLLGGSMLLRNVETKYPARCKRTILWPKSLVSDDLLNRKRDKGNTVTLLWKWWLRRWHRQIFVSKKRLKRWHCQIAVKETELQRWHRQIAVKKTLLEGWPSQICVQQCYEGDTVSSFPSNGEKKITASSGYRV